MPVPAYTGWLVLRVITPFRMVPTVFVPCRVRKDHALEASYTRGANAPRRPAGLLVSVAVVGCATFEMDLHKRSCLVRKREVC